ncbi:MAG TPA: MFS transporter [Hanamia sp.]|nr:MFS transporter [Hanamia sp.]
MEPTKTSKKRLISIIAASSAGTLIEWYDFFIFGSLATIISTEFFPKDNPVAAFLATLATFSAGLVVRPFGALFFGRLGDIIGRKYTFMVTLILMGGSTVGMGLVLGYESIGFFAPLIVLILRLLQGLAIGGEYGGAATYVAEHAPVNQRGFWTSWVQASTGLAFVLSITVILLTKSLMDSSSWESWGWRIPFLVSVFMVAVSVYMRKRMSESPLFTKAKAEGKTSSNPLKESFGNKANLKVVLLAFLGLTVGGGVIGWVGFYAQSFLIRTVSLDYEQANQVMIFGILIGIPFFFLFGWLSDRIGRKYLLMLGILAGITGFRPIFNNMYQVTNLQHKIENKGAKIITTETQPLPGNHSLFISATQHFYTDGTISKEIKKNITDKVTRNEEMLTTIKVTNTDKWKLIFLVFLLEFIFTLSFGPLAAFIVEMFPLNIRYTSISLPYHFGYGIFGGMAPYFASYLSQKASEAGKPDYYLAGLNYPILLMSISLIIGLIYLKENNREHSFRIIPASIMNQIKKWLGIVWIALGLLAAWYGIFKMGIPKIISGNQEDIVFGIIIMLIITPVAALGLFFFGKYALQGEYDE